jgi:RNA polymerase sigma factor (sigma-70 family)
MSPADDHDQCLALIEANQGILHKVANAYCPHPEDRKDLLQEITIQVWRSYPRFDGRCKFSTWMYRIALNVAISFHRQEHPHRQALMHGDEHLVDLPDPAHEARPPEDLQILQRFIDGLDDFNKALVLLYLDDCSHQEIAEVLGITTTNVATKIGRLKQRLRQHFASQPSA